MAPTSPIPWPGRPCLVCLLLPPPPHCFSDAPGTDPLQHLGPCCALGLDCLSPNLHMVPSSLPSASKITPSPTARPSLSNFLFLLCLHHPLIRDTFSSFLRVYRLFPVLGSWFHEAVILVHFVNSCVPGAQHGVWHTQVNAQVC